jgi:hypothetical protein
MEVKVNVKTGEMKRELRKLQARDAHLEFLICQYGNEIKDNSKRIDTLEETLLILSNIGTNPDRPIRMPAHAPYSRIVQEILRVIETPKRNGYALNYESVGHDVESVLRNMGILEQVPRAVRCIGPRK